MSTAAGLQVSAPPRVRPGWLVRSSAIAASIFRRGACPSIAASAASPAERMDAIDRVYRDYVFYGNLSREDVEGRRVLEVGPGGDLGVALQFLAAGASRVVVLDTNASVRVNGATLRLYHALRERSRGEERRRFDAAVDFRHGLWIDPARLRIIQGVPLEDAGSVMAPSSFSLIVSWERLEVVQEIDRAFYAMERLLRPGGRMLHKIGLGDRGMFSTRGLAPLEFLTVPKPVYALMGPGAGRPNRRRASYYRRMMRELGYDAGLLATAVAGHSGEILPCSLPFHGDNGYLPSALRQVHAIRPRLARPFRQLSDEDLAVTGIFLGAVKPG
jgi:SAM-dependent methyltransferase